MKFVIVFWMLGILPDGSFTDNRYQMVMFEPSFELRSECELYMVQREDEWLSSIESQTHYALKDEWTGIAIDGEPECRLFNHSKWELLENGQGL